MWADPCDVREWSGKSCRCHVGFVHLYKKLVIETKALIKITQTTWAEIHWHGWIMIVPSQIINALSETIFKNYLFLLLLSRDRGPTFTAPPGTYGSAPTAPATELHITWMCIMILLMVQKSDVHQLRLVVYPIIYRGLWLYSVLYIPGGYWLFGVFFRQQYHWCHAC